MRTALMIVLMTVSASAGAVELEPAGTIPLSGVAKQLEWTKPGKLAADASVAVRYSPEGGCFSAPADVLGLVRQWIVEYSQDHPFDALEVYCRPGADGAVVALVEVPPAGGESATLHALRADREGSKIDSGLFDAPIETGPPVAGHLVDFALEGDRVSGLLLVEEPAKRAEAAASGSPVVARCRYYSLLGGAPSVTAWEALAVDRLTTADARRFLLLAIGEGTLQLVRLGASASIATSMPLSWELPDELVGRRARSQLEDLQYLLSVFASLASDGQSSELFVSPDIKARIDELATRSAEPPPSPEK